MNIFKKLKEFLFPVYIKKEDLIIGKWYKGFENGKIAAKFSGYPTYDWYKSYFHFSESININNHFPYYNDYGNWEFPEKLQECDIEEIKKYLPKNQKDIIL